ncbi:MAG: TetR/AcrR family transcriptional regulator [Deltaproteobacteria bacterium]|uniref:TetR/AcrR family transcriptional regulator n=1 Tax=Candidatus Zymogenus saltonus TaxID=2844893 RepID=A0A9D8KFA3_9DELT|nr:TetR/AcrR family transcriptional regulator [Candidatus Zymogenus saltonus]
MTSGEKRKKSHDLKEEFEKFGETERRILEAAISIFGEKGFDGARIDEIAKKSGVNKGMIYYYFGSKEKLHTDIIEMVFKKVAEIIMDNLADMNPDTLYEGISSFIETYIDFIHTNYSIVRVLVWELARGGEIIRGVIRKEMSTKVPVLVSGFNEAVKAGKLRPMDPRHVFVNIIAMVVFYFAANRVISAVWNDDAMSAENVEARKREVKEFVIRAISAEDLK